MAKRMVIMLLAMTAFVAAIGLVKFQQIQAAIAQSSSFEPPPEAVTTLIAREQDWEQEIGSIGTVSAVHGVMVSADLPGIVDAITFESGSKVRSGQVLVKLDTRQEEAQLVAAEAQRDLDGLNLERTRGLKEQGITSQADYDQASAKAKQSEARVGETRATIRRKVIRAPFSGVLGIRQVNLGQYLNGGDPIVPLQSLDPILVDFGVPQEEIRSIRTSREVRVDLEGDSSAERRGKITALDSLVDPATRNIHVQATLSNAEGSLQPGMFVKVRAILPSKESVIALPATAVRYAPYGNSVFIVEQLKDPKKGKSYRGVRQQFVKLGSGQGDLIAVLAGVKSGEEVVTSGVFKLRNGAAVLVNNDIKPSSSPSPKPEDS
ncbi:MAG TPA: efflux RND transporter periplasmic adaptor subunit [Candidatus Polarisedimenticolia bacterium]|jgi:membrane fusion protein (multidrug efflux system)|nr:efflux RND transporter periplasmic adaptor subunit [Candidatus Polarisedimenticolia bacterium]